MCIIPYLPNRAYADVARQKCIQAPHKRHLFYRLLQIHMKKLLLTVYACICPATACHSYITLENSRQGIFNHLLNRKGIPLPLPSMISCAFIGNFKKISQSDLGFCSKQNCNTLFYFAIAIVQIYAHPSIENFKIIWAASGLSLLLRSSTSILSAAFHC